MLIQTKKGMLLSYALFRLFDQNPHSPLRSLIATGKLFQALLSKGKNMDVFLRWVSSRPRQIGE